MSHASIKRVCVLGCTGSIGGNTLDVVEHLSHRLTIDSLVAHSNWRLLAEQCHRHKPRVAVITGNVSSFDRDAFPKSVELKIGPDAVPAVAAAKESDIVVSAVVGAAGLHGTWAAVDAGKTVAIANKETLVVAGPLITQLAKQRRATLLPVDSEHSAIFQALAGHAISDVAKIVLTASGGPFRGKSASELAKVTHRDALKHPTWQMGPKITIDSATLMNKALELIEARWLFDVSVDKLDAIVHPESIVHGFVEFVDGSVIAQLSPPDMRLPIQLALTYPDRTPGPAKRLDWQKLASLNFQPIDRVTFPAIDFGFEAAARGGTVGAVLNAANEIAVASFLEDRVSFPNIVRCVRAVIDSHEFDPNPSLETLFAYDRWARQEATKWLTR